MYAYFVFPAAVTVNKGFFINDHDVTDNKVIIIKTAIKSTKQNLKITYINTGYYLCTQKSNKIMSKGKILDVTNEVKWIGVLDPDLRVFDVIMETKFGTTYNSYFINAQKKTIVETVKERFNEEYIEKITSLCSPEEIEYIILDHTEPDHSGSLKHLLKVASNATVVGSGNAIRYLKDIVGFEFKSITVKDGDTLDLGNKTLKFIGAPNLHWPDSIFTYLVEEKILFSCDAFGAHYCDERMFDDKTGNFDEAFVYYFDVILKPFSKFMLKAIEKIKDLEIKAICPGHGPILRTYWKKYVDLSAEYSNQELKFRKPENLRVFIPYVSAYGYTKTIAEKIAEGIKNAGDISIELSDIQDKDFHFLNEKLSGSSALIVGSPTINQNVLPQIYNLFGAINPIRDKGKLFGAFGSYGWSGEAPDIIFNSLTTLKLKASSDVLKIKFFPSEEVMEKLFNYGLNFGKQLIEYQKTCEN